MGSEIGKRRDNEFYKNKKMCRNCRFCREGVMPDGMVRNYCNVVKPESITAESTKHAPHHEFSVSWKYVCDHFGINPMVADPATEGRGEIGSQVVVSEADVPTCFSTVVDRESGKLVLVRRFNVKLLKKHLGVRRYTAKDSLKKEVKRACSNCYHSYDTDGKYRCGIINHYQRTKPDVVEASYYFPVGANCKCGLFHEKGSREAIRLFTVHQFRNCLRVEKDSQLKVPDLKLFKSEIGYKSP